MVFKVLPFQFAPNLEVLMNCQQTRSFLKILLFCLLYIFLLVKFLCQQVIHLPMHLIQLITQIMKTLSPPQHIHGMQIDGEYILLVNMLLKKQFKYTNMKRHLFMPLHLGIG
jgi:hypothetical protein